MSLGPQKGPPGAVPNKAPRPPVQPEPGVRRIKMPRWEWDRLVEKACAAEYEEMGRRRMQALFGGK